LCVVCWYGTSKQHFRSKKFAPRSRWSCSATASWDASSDMMRFIATTSVDARVCFKRTGKPLFYYVDSDFLPNYGTSYDNRRSTTGYCSYLAGACVSHCSRRQTTTATSTAHAEYLAAFECGREAIRIRVLLKDMGLPQLRATTTFEDNEKTCIRMSEAEPSTPRPQYIDVRYHWLRDATRSRAPNAHQRNQHEAGYCSRICLNNVEIRTWLEKRVLYAL
jgi:hypothetical protein